MWRSSFSIRSAIGICVSMSIVLVSVVSHADIVKCGFTFDDDAFVDQLVASGGSLSTNPPAGNVASFITDLSLATAVALRSDDSFLVLRFTDNVAVNGPGNDIVIFEQFDNAPGFDVTIGGMTQFVQGGAILCAEGNPQINNNAAQIDLTDFGIALGATVSELRLTNDLDLRPFPAISAVAALNTTVIGIDVDINPGDFPNEIDLFNNNIVPVIILGSDTFDVTDVDWTTLAFGPAGAALEHGAEPGEFEDHQQDDNGDGFDDLHMHYFTQETGIAFGDTEACVTGQTLAGASFEGCDSITTFTGNTGSSSCGLGFELVFLLPPLMWLRRQRRRRIH